MKHNQPTGKWGEEIATEYLIKKGCEIIRRNVRTPYGAINIIAQRGNITIFLRRSKNTDIEQDGTTR